MVALWPTVAPRRARSTWKVVAMVCNSGPRDAGRRATVVTVPLKIIPAERAICRRPMALGLLQRCEGGDGGGSIWLKREMGRARARKNAPIRVVFVMGISKLSRWRE